MNHPPFLHFQVNGFHFGMILIEGGVYRMGSDKTLDQEAYDDEAPVHEVKAPSFYLAQYPVTQAFWKAVTGKPWERLAYNGKNRPMERVSWDDAQAFMAELAQKTRAPFRLPTEAEWEYAARGGRFNMDHLYAGSPRVKEVAWFDDNSHGETKPAGRKFPNELGLYDMSGNVWEWCEDQWHGNYNGAPDDGSAWVGQEEGSYRVLRGGGWLYASRFCRSACRLYWLPGNRSFNLGFRLALSLQSVGNRPVGL